MKGITKRYASNGILACDRVDLTLQAGMVHAIVGENGAGKSTLMKILSGDIMPDEGSLRLFGSPVEFADARDALDAGVGMTHQIIHTFPGLSLIDHLVVMDRSYHGLRKVPVGKLRREILEVCRTYGIETIVDRPAEQLGAEELQKGALISLIHRGVRVFIFDEPPIFFHPIARRLAGEQACVVLITHRIHEALAVADSITVMRQGRIVGEFRSGTIDAHALASVIMGAGPAGPGGPMLSTRSQAVPTDTPVVEPGTHRHHSPPLTPSVTAVKQPPPPVQNQPVLEVSGLTGGRPGTADHVRDITFSLAPGETLAVIGIKENGLQALEHLLSGQMHGPYVRESGTIGVLPGSLAPSSQTPTARGARARASAHEASVPPEHPSTSIGYIPSDRLRMGGDVSSTVIENLMIHRRRDPELMAQGFPWNLIRRVFPVCDRSALQRMTESIIERYHIRAFADDTLLHLSGGNIQKLMAAREFVRAPRLLICADVSWGLDIATRRALFDEIQRMKESGVGVLLLSTEVETVLEEADRIAVLRHGELMDIFLNDGSLDAAAIGRSML